MIKIKANLFVLIILVITVSECSVSIGDHEDPPPPDHAWTWVSGSRYANQAGTYGTQGLADALNVPGARYGAVSWLGSNGKPWIFGGYGLDSVGTSYSHLNDLWKYDPTTNEWTWVSGSNTGNQAGVYGTKGTADASNVPGARHSAASWVDSQGKLWVFGGEWADWDEGLNCMFNDLWKFDPATNEWTWVSGSNAVDQAGVYGTKGTADASNVPGARVAAVSWIDSQGKFWLFGGDGFDSISEYPGNLNDLWKYDPATNEWTWVSGSNTCDQAGVYGTKGIADASNVPGGRLWALSWIDSSGRLWLFGGMGYASVVFWGELNDLWKYDPATNEWTWLSGSDTIDQTGVYGIKGVADESNTPGARDGAVSWIDSSGKFWLFGGRGFGSSSSDYINDLWKYDPAANEWTWVSGSNAPNQAGIYGTKGVPDPANVPGGRWVAVSWTDSNDKLWLFSGMMSNDLWRYVR